MSRALLFLSFLIFGCITLRAQPGYESEPPFRVLKAFLGLSDDQVSKIVSNLNSYRDYVIERSERMGQVQLEIREETAKNPLDPSGLGNRYAEIETLCRSTRAEALAAQTRNLDILTGEQRIKLKALEDAVKLLPTIDEALNAGLLGPAGPYIGSQGINAYRLTPVSVELLGCRVPYTSNGFGIGDQVAAAASSPTMTESNDALSRAGRVSPTPKYLSQSPQTHR
jgi:hypothetical protein